MVNWRQREKSAVHRNQTRPVWSLSCATTAAGEMSVGQMPGPDWPRSLKHNLPATDPPRRNSPQTPCRPLSAVHAAMGWNQRGTSRGATSCVDRNNSGGVQPEKTIPGRSTALHARSFIRRSQSLVSVDARRNIAMGAIFVPATAEFVIVGFAKRSHTNSRDCASRR